MATLFDWVHALLQYQATKMLYFLIYSRRLMNWWWSLVLFNVFLYLYWAFNLPGMRGSAFCFLFSGDCLDDSLFNSVTSNLQTNCAYSSSSLLTPLSSQLLENNVNKLPCCLCFLHKLDSVSIHISEQWKFIESFVPKMNQISSVNKENKLIPLKTKNVDIIFSKP